MSRGPAISRCGLGRFSGLVREHGRTLALLWLWLLGACQLQSGVHSSTLLAIDIEIERAVRVQSDRISIAAAQGSSAERAEQAIPVYVQDFMLAGPDDDRVQRVVLRPRGLAAPFVSIRVSAEAEHRLAPVAEARLDTRYGEGEWRIATLRLGAPCIDVSCEQGATCASGACVSAELKWSDLPLFWPASDAGRTIESDAGSSAPDASATPRDASLSVDATGIATGLGQSLTDDGDAGGLASDACADAHGGCDVRVSCSSARGAAVCGACPEGFDDVHHDGTLCADIDDCASGGCPEHARCENLRGDFRCACEPGYVDSDAGCSDVDECASGALRCGASATCVNRPGGADCQCLAGYVMSQGGCVDIDECATGASDCDTSPPACVNTPGGFTCRCPEGYNGRAVGPDGCVMGDPCKAGNGGCEAHRDCLNTSPGPTCGDCMPGYQKDGPTGCVKQAGQTGTGGAAAGEDTRGFDWPWF